MVLEALRVPLAAANGNLSGIAVKLKILSEIARIESFICPIF